MTTSGTVLVYNPDDPAQPARAAIRRSLGTRALFPDGHTVTAGAPTGWPGCLVPSYALGFAPGGRALTVVMDRIMPDNSSRDTVHLAGGHVGRAARRHRGRPQHLGRAARAGPRRPHRH